MNDMIKLIVMDVDGTLTDGKIYLSNNGDEYKAFNVKDGYAIKKVRESGIITCILTGRKSNCVSFRGKELNVDYVIQGSSDKVFSLNALIDSLNISYDEVLYIGDDMNDFDCMKKCSYKACPNDASIEIKKISNYVSSKNGGEGAVRDIIEHFTLI